MALRKVISEIAGTVWKIEAAPGADLAEEDVILVVESMKMEIPVLSPRAGRLLRVLVGEGELVREGQVLAEIDHA